MPSLAAVNGSKTTQPTSGCKPDGGLPKEAKDQKPTSCPTMTALRLPVPVINTTGPRDGVEAAEKSSR